MYTLDLIYFEVIKELKTKEFVQNRIWKPARRRPFKESWHKLKDINNASQERVRV